MGAKRVRVKHVYQCYPLYQAIYGGNPILKAHEARCVREVWEDQSGRTSREDSLSILELFSGNGEHAPFLRDEFLRMDPDLVVGYIGVDLYAPGADMRLDLSRSLDSGTLPKSDLIVLGFRSVETTACDDNGNVTPAALHRLLNNVATACHRDTIVYLDTSSHPSPTSQHEDFEHSIPLDRHQKRRFEEHFKLEPVSNPQLKFRIENTYDLMSDNYRSHLRDVELVNHAGDVVLGIAVAEPLRFKYWTTAELIHLASASGMEVCGVYFAPEDLFASSFITPVAHTIPADAQRPNKYALRRLFKPKA